MRGESDRVKAFMEGLGATQHDTANGYWHIEGQGFVAPWQAAFFHQQLEVKVVEARLSELNLLVGLAQSYNPVSDSEYVGLWDIEERIAHLTLTNNKTTSHEQEEK